MQPPTLKVDLDQKSGQSANKSTKGHRDPSFFSNTPFTDSPFFKPPHFRISDRTTDSFSAPSQRLYCGEF
ncbi:hypothetical protein RIF29_19866 [Crotalaria pallida]|uniref:Uncharacterized protein n=1 Tax=Crotalaria pallida TaxID=3830 RepID=A0AAN9F1G7_CROPI